MDNNNTGAWVIGAVIVLVLGFGIYWFMNREPAGTETSNETATTTPNTATTTTSTPTTVRETRTNATVAEVVASLADASTFNSYLTSTGVSASVKGTGPYTIFVPSNAAFGKLAPGTVSGLSASAKKRLVQYHVVSGKKLDVDALETSTIQALSRDMLNFEALGANARGRVNNSTVIRQYNAKNGVVYIVDAVLIPPQAPLN